MGRPAARPGRAARPCAAAGAAAGAALRPQRPAPARGGGVRAGLAGAIRHRRRQPHGDPLEVLRHLLGGGPGSRLHRALVEGGLAVSASASYDSDVFPGPTSTCPPARRDVEPARVEEAAMAVVKRLLDEGGPTEAEVARSIRQMTAGALLALDGLGAAPRMLGTALAIGQSMDSVEFWPRRLRAVTRDGVAAAAAAVLGGMPSASGWLMPEGASAPAEVRA